MATGDVTKFGPYDIKTIDQVKTDLEAANVAVADTVWPSPNLNGSFFVFVLEA